MHFMAEKKWKKRSGAVSYSYLKDSAFAGVKRDIKCKIRFVKVVPYIMYKKGVPFL